MLSAMLRAASRRIAIDRECSTGASNSVVGARPSLEVTRGTVRTAPGVTGSDDELAAGCTIDADDTGVPLEAAGTARAYLLRESTSRRVALISRACAQSVRSTWREKLGSGTPARSPAMTTAPCVVPSATWCTEA